MVTTNIVFLFDEGDPEALAGEVWASFGAAEERDRYAGDGRTFPGTDSFRVGVDVPDQEDRAFRGGLHPTTDERGPRTLVTPPESTTVVLTAVTDALYNADSGSHRERLASELAAGVAGVYEGFDTTPLFVYGPARVTDTAIINDRCPSPVDGDGELRYVTWLMVFPPATVAEFGRERLLDAPVWHAEELADGAVLLVATASPNVVDGPLYEVLADLQSYLGLPPAALPS